MNQGQFSESRRIGERDFIFMVFTPAGSGLCENARAGTELIYASGQIWKNTPRNLLQQSLGGALESLRTLWAVDNKGRSEPEEKAKSLFEPVNRAMLFTQGERGPCSVYPAQPLRRLSKHPPRVVLTGGGTGGHIYPAIAIACELRALDPECQVLYVGTEKGLEASLVPPTGIPLRTVRSGGIRGKSPTAAVRAVALMAAGFLDARRILSSFAPHVVVGTGGYVSAPVVLAAKAMRIPCLIQEQNVVPGATNRYLSLIADATCVPYHECVQYFPRRARMLVTGNPVRREVLGATREEGLKLFGLDASRPVLLVLGGSRGAKRLADCTVDMAREIAAGGGRRWPFQVILATGHEHFEGVKERLAGIGDVLHGNIRVERYIHNMGEALAAADLVVARAGAITLAEITARGKPAVLVPSPNVVGDHQTLNARVLERRGGAVVVKDRELTGSGLLRLITDLISQPRKLGAMGEASRSLGRPEAARNIALEALKAAALLAR